MLGNASTVLGHGFFNWDCNVKDNYDNLFTNSWCPLLGDLSDFNEIRYAIPNSQVTRCVKIIEKSRELWGGNPRYMTFTNWPEEKDMPPPFGLSPFVNHPPVPIPQYPFWKVEDARTIVRTSIQVHQYILEPGGAPSPTPDIVWERALDIVRTWSMKRVNEKTTDSEILAALAIAEAWCALDSILHYGEKEEAPEVLKTIQIASGLLAKAQELASNALIKNKEQILQDQKDDIEKKDVTVTALQKALIEKKDVISPGQREKARAVQSERKLSKSLEYIRWDDDEEKFYAKAKNRETEKELELTGQPYKILNYLYNASNSESKKTSVPIDTILHEAAIKKHKKGDNISEDKRGHLHTKITPIKDELEDAGFDRDRIRVIGDNCELDIKFIDNFDDI